jgi:hypothetical protein
MAITKTERINLIQIHTGNGNIGVTYHVEIDDPDDDSLPISTRSSKEFPHSSDVSGEPQIVQDVAAAAWALIDAPVVGETGP